MSFQAVLFSDLMEICNFVGLNCKWTKFVQSSKQFQKDLNFLEPPETFKRALRILGFEWRGKFVNEC